MYQYSRSDGLLVGRGVTYKGSLGSFVQVVLITFAWWNMYLSLQQQKQRNGSTTERRQNKRLPDVNKREYMYSSLGQQTEGQYKKRKWETELPTKRNALRKGARLRLRVRGCLDAPRKLPSASREVMFKKRPFIWSSYNSTTHREEEHLGIHSPGVRGLSPSLIIYVYVFLFLESKPNPSTCTIPAAGEKVARGDLGLGPEERVQRLGVRRVLDLRDVVEALDVVPAFGAARLRPKTNR